MFGWERSTHLLKAGQIVGVLEPLENPLKYWSYPLFSDNFDNNFEDKIAPIFAILPRIIIRNLLLLLLGSGSFIQAIIIAYVSCPSTMPLAYILMLSSLLNTPPQIALYGLLL